MMADPLTTGSSALLAFQRAIATTSHNIANSATEGYTRQGVNLSAMEGIDHRFGHVGQGVSVEGIRRFEDQFAETRIQKSTTELSRLNTLNNYQSQIDHLFSDLGSDISSSLNSLYTSINDANNNPTDFAARDSVLNALDHFYDRVNSQQNSLMNMQSVISEDAGLVVSDINENLNQLGDLNAQITAATNRNGGQAPSDLIDRRNVLISQLSESIDIETYSTASGLNISLKNGQNLVIGNEVNTLHVTRNTSRSLGIDISVNQGTGIKPINEQISGGKLGALIDLSDNIIPKPMSQLGQMALVVADTINQSQLAGVDLEGTTGKPLFHIPTSDVLDSPTNVGDAQISTTLINPQELTTSDYRLDRNGANFRLTRLSDNTSVSGPGPIEMDGLSVSVSGNFAQNDSFTIQPTRNVARNIQLLSTSGEDLALGQPMVVNTSPVNTSQVTSTMTALDTDDPNFLEPFQISFDDPPQSYSIQDSLTGTTLSGPHSFSPGDSIVFNGWSINFDGIPEGSDQFNSARSTLAPSDNRNGHNLHERLNDQLVLGELTLQQSYGQLIASVGQQARQTELNIEASQALHNQSIAARDAVSGVNLDEEAIALTRYQQAYQAAAQIITSSDMMFQSLMGAIRG